MSYESPPHATRPEVVGSTTERDRPGHESNGMERGASDAPTVGTPSAAARKVLLVEENVIIQRILAGLLAKRGHSLSVATDARQAVAALGGEDFDLVLLAVGAGESDGPASVDAIREAAREKGRYLPVVALVAGGTEDGRPRCLSAGFDDQLAKPVQAERLWQVVDEHTSGSRHAGAAAARSVTVMDREAALGRVGGDWAFLAEMTTLFLQGDYLRLTAEIRGAIDRGDAKGLASAAHSLKNWVGNFAAPSVFAAVETLEETARREVWPGVEAAHDASVRAIARLIPELSSLASGHPTTTAADPDR